MYSKGIPRALFKSNEYIYSYVPPVPTYASSYVSYLVVMLVVIAVEGVAVAMVVVVAVARLSLEAVRPMVVMSVDVAALRLVVVVAVGMYTKVHYTCIHQVEVLVPLLVLDTLLYTLVWHRL